MSTFILPAANPKGFSLSLFLAHLHKLDTMNRFFVNLFILRVWRMQETYALEEVRDKTDKRDVA